MDPGKLAESPLPLYFQIATHLEQQLDSGHYPVGARLPNEKDLAKTFGVSLITIRGAMRVLLDKRLIVRYAGKGTFVAHRLPIKRMWAIGSLTDLVATGMNSTMRLIWRRQLFMPPDIAKKLGLPTTKTVYSLRTVRECDGEPFMLTDTFHPSEIASLLKKSDFTKAESLSRLVITIVEGKIGKKIESVRQAISVIPAPQDIARLLDVEPGEVLLTVDRDFFVGGNILVQAARAYYRTDHYRYVMNVATVGSAEENSSPVENVRNLSRFRGRRAV